MSTHVNPPWKSFVLFLLVAGVAWAGYEFLWVRNIFAGGADSAGGGALTNDQRDAIATRINTLYETDRCFVSLRGNLNWRPRDDYYRVELVVAEGCDDRARGLCQEISDLISKEWNVPSSVWAFDSAGRQLGSYVR